ncbi:MAG: carboxylating nicotinate-nucleotide diphosphorylase [Candidatus Omnitrophica bacterium]|nr:carboxylating nicotinate-nucleotide diphosphorylase [Candidatus Omnitrophota bacterium]
MPLTTDHIIRNALKEDACRDDITSKAFIPAAARSQGVILFREEGLICGGELVRKIFRILDPTVLVKLLSKDGSTVKRGKNVIYLKGKTRSLLAGERVALNFLSHLSGIATVTQRFVKAVAGTKAVILDTRKTTPSLRELERYAVACGGGANHRFNLSSMYLVKDNHLSALSQPDDLAQRIQKIRQQRKHPRIEIEIDSLQQLPGVAQLRPDIILLDNMKTPQLKKAVAFVRKLRPRPLLEASGGITLTNVKTIAQTGVDRISIGSLTHSVKALDVSLELNAL